MKNMTSMNSILGPAKSKAAAKGKATAKKKSPAKEAMPMPTEAVMHREPKTVRITAAENGMTVSSYGPQGEKLKVAKDMKEAMAHCQEMLK